MPNDSQSRRTVWIPIAVATLLNGALLAGIAVRNPAYLSDADLLADPDAQGYYTLGQNLIERGVYSRATEQPYALDILRTPLFPLFVGVLNAIGGLAAVHLGGATMHVLSCALLYLLATTAYNARIGLAASLFLATDAMLVSCNFMCMSESTFLAPLLASLVIFCSALHATTPSRCIAVQILVAAIFLGIATLVRPTSLYLGGPFALALVVRYWRGPHRGAGVGLAALTLLASLVLPAAWAARNWVEFRIPKVTPVDTHNLVYWLGAAGYQEELGIELYDAHAQISREFGIPTFIEAQNYWLSNLPPAEIERRLKAAVPSVLAKYPVDLVIGCIKGVLKATVSHSTWLVGQLLANPWTPPTMGGLVRFDGTAWKTLFGNSPLLVVVFFWQLLHVAAAWIAAGFGLVAAWKPPADRVVVALLVLVFAYLYATIVMFGLEAFFRCRIPMLPLLYMFSGLGVVSLVDWRRRGRRTPGRAAGSS